MTATADGVRASPADWRDRSGRRRSRASRWVSRLVLTLILLGLLAVFLQIVPGCDRLDARIVVLPVRYYDVPLPPYPGPRDTSEWFPRFAEADGVEVEVRADLDHLESIKGLDGYLGSTDRGTNLILYVSRLVASPNEGDPRQRPSLVCGDPLDREGNYRLYPAAQLLAQVRNCPAQFKLVVLDVAPIQNDPRSGVLVSEFQTLLEELVEGADLADSTLWVMTSCAPAESAHFRRGGTVFGWAVREGLGGKADGWLEENERDGVVDLAELYGYVRDSVDTWVRRHGGGARQTPRLLGGGRSGAADPASIPKLKLLRLPPEPEPNPENGKADEPGESARAALGDSQVASDANSEAEGGSAGSARPDETVPGPPAKSAGSGPQAADTESAAAPAADAAGDPPDAGPPPDATAEAQKPPATATAAEKPPVAAAGDVSAGDASELDLLAAAWRRRDALRADSSPGQWSPVDYAPHRLRAINERLLAFERRIRWGALSDEDRSKLKSLADELSGFGPPDKQVSQAHHESLRRLEGVYDGSIARAIRLKNELIFLAPYYVRWHGHACFRSSSKLPQFDDTRELLKHLAALVAQIAEFQDLNESSTSTREEIDACERRISQARRDVLRHRDNLDRELGREVKASLSDGPLARLETLLHTPLLAADLRLPLVKACAEMESSPSEPRRPAVDPHEVWARLGEQAYLEVLLVRLWKPDFLPKVNDPSAFPGLENGKAPWDAFRDLGDRLYRLHGGLPDEVREGVQTPSSRDPAPGIMLRLVDARDMGRLDASRVDPARLVDLALPAMSLRQFREPRLAIEANPREVELLRDPRSWVPFELTLTGSELSDGKGRLRLEYDRDRLQVRRADAPQGDEPGWAVEIENDRPLQVAFEARPVDVAGWRAPAELRIHLEADGRNAVQRIVVRMPADDRIELLVDRILDRTTGATEPQEFRQTGNTHYCLAFPARKTEYLFRLKNHSRRAREVAVQLWAAPAAAFERDDRAGPLDAFGAPIEGFYELTDPIPLALSEGDAPQRIVLPEPAPSEEKEKPSPAGPEAEAKPAAEPAPRDVAGGMVCVIRDSESGKSWKHWIELIPVAPRKYVAPEVHYDHGRGEIAIVVGIAESGIVPPISKDAPVRVVWESIEGQHLNKERDRGEVVGRAQTDRLELRARVDPEATPRVTIHLTVDDYPRAFVYQVECNRDRSSLDYLRSLEAVRIQKPEARAAFQVPLEGPLAIEFQVDAPIHRFDRAAGSRDRVEVGIDGDRDGTLDDRERQHSFRTDRQYSVWFEEFSPQGVLAVRTEVSDFRVPLDRVGLLGEKDLVAQIRLDERVAASQSVPVVFDDRPPRVERFNVEPRSVPAKGKIQVALAVDDQSGVERIEFGFDSKPRNGRFDDEELIAAETLRAAPWEATLTLDESLEPGKTYDVMARVFDRAGHEPTIAAQPINVLSEAAAPAPAKKTGTIKGRIFVPGASGPANREVWWRHEVHVQGEGIDETLKPDRVTGEFVLKDVPYGSYSFTAMGTFSGGFQTRKYAGKAQVSLESSEVTVNIPMTE